MVTSATAWSWLDGECLPYAKTILAMSRTGTVVYDSKDTDRQWLAKLTLDIKNHVVRRQTSSFRAADYIYGASLDSIYRLPRTIPYSDSDDHLDTLVLTYLHSAIVSWLHFPPGAGHVKGILVNRLRGFFGSDDVLLLPDIWDAFQRVRFKVHGPCITWEDHLFSVPMLDAFFENVASMPIANVNSAERRLLDRLGELAARAFDMVSSSRDPSRLPSSEHFLSYY